MHAILGWIDNTTTAPYQYDSSAERFATAMNQLRGKSDILTAVDNLPPGAGIDTIYQFAQGTMPGMGDIIGSREIYLSDILGDPRSFMEEIINGIRFRGRTINH